MEVNIDVLDFDGTKFIKIIGIISWPKLHCLQNTHLNSVNTTKIGPAICITFWTVHYKISIEQWEIQQSGLSLSIGATKSVGNMINYFCIGMELVDVHSVNAMILLRVAQKLIILLTLKWNMQNIQQINAKKQQLAELTLQD